MNVRRPALLPLTMAVGILAVSTAAPLIKLCQDAAPVVIAAARLGIAACVLVSCAAGLRGRALLAGSASQKKYVILAGAFLAAHFFFWVTSLKHTSVLSSAVIVTTNPIFVGAASYLLFKEKVHKHLTLAILLAVSGGLLIVLSDARRPAGADSLYGDFLSLCGAVMGSCYLLVGRKVRRQVDTLAYITPVYAVGAVILLVVALGTGHGFAGYSKSTYVYLVLLALVPQLLGHTAFNWALRHMTATAPTVFLLGEPIGASIIAYFLLDESIRAMQLAGGALILIGIAIASQAQTPRTDEPPQAA